MKDTLQLTKRKDIPFFSLPLWEKINVCGHGFSSRLGGSGWGRQDSFDLGFKGGEEPLTVLENRERFLGIWRKKNSALFCGEQVHGIEIAIIGRKELSAEKRILPATDALVTAEKGPVLGAFCSDCLLVFFLEPSVPVAGIAHAGWRGTCQGIVYRVVQCLKEEFAVDPQKIQVLLSPSISSCCYEVGEEVLESCHHSPWKEEMVLKPGRNGHCYFDLRASNSNILMTAGIKPDSIFGNDFCTKCNSNLFYSYRGSGGKITGSHLGIIFLKDTGLNSSI